MRFQGKKLRTEQKYYLHLHEYLILKRQLSPYLSLDSHSISRDGYNIQSLYFDNMSNSALIDKNEGIFKREKYRIRIYNGSDALISLERKSKFGEYVIKESASLSRGEYDAILAGEYTFLSKRPEELLHQFYIALQTYGYRPVTIVDYWREAYIYPTGNVRITFDKRLSAVVNSTDLFDKHKTLQETISEHLTILEVKFDTFLPSHIRDLLTLKSHQRSTISKYVICRETVLEHYTQ